MADDPSATRQDPDPPRGGTPNGSDPGRAGNREQSPWALAGLGVQFFGAIILFVYAGAWLDTRFDASPLFLLLGLFVGGGGSFYASYRRLTARSEGRR